METTKGPLLLSHDQKKKLNFQKHFFLVEAVFYFFQGLYISGLQGYMNFYMTKVFHLNFETIATVFAIVGIPTYLKIFTGLLSDKVSIGKYGRRKPYLVIGGILYIPAFALLVKIESYGPLWLGAIVICYVCLVIVDGTADALTVDITPDCYASKMQGYANGGRFSGMAVGFILVPMAGKIGWSAIIAVLGLAAAMQAFVTLLFKEVKNEDGVLQTSIPLKASFKMAFSSKATWAGMIFAMLFMGTSGILNTLGSMIMKNTNATIYSIANLSGSFIMAATAFLVGSLVSKRGGFSNKNVFIMFAMVCIFMVPYAFVQGHWDNYALVIFAQCAFSIGKSMISVITYGLLMRICMDSIEGFMFALFTSVMNIGQQFLAPKIHAFLGETMGFGMIKAVYMMLPIMLIGLLFVPTINKSIDEQARLIEKAAQE